MALDFGSGIHEALEYYYLAKANIPPYLEKAAQPNFIEVALNAFDRWYDWADERIASDKGLPSEAKRSLQNQLIELADLGEEMLYGYHQYSSGADDFTVHAVEGTMTGAGTSWLSKHWEDREHVAEHSEAAVVLHKDSGRLLCPILDPDTRAPLPKHPCLTTRIDLLVLRRPEGVRGLWVYDHKTSSSQPSDKGLDFDDQVTAMCYIVWRWLGIVPRGVAFNYLIKHAPKEPRILKSGKLSTAKDQLTTADKYRGELIERGLMLRDGTIQDEKYRDAYQALLSYDWDRFFTRDYVQRNIYELLNFEERLFDEWQDMADARDGELITYPNFSRMWCPRCEMGPLCLAMEDGSDVEAIRDTRYMQAPDRKATKRI